jgi:hypothetical protein
MKTTFTLLLVVFIGFFGYSQSNNVEISGKNYSIPENGNRLRNISLIEGERPLNGKVLRVVQFYDLPTKKIRDFILGSGWVFQDYFGENAYLMEIPIGARIAPESRVRGVTPFSDGMKLSYLFSNSEYLKNAYDNGRWIVFVETMSNIEIEPYLSQMENEGISILEKNEGIRTHSFSILPNYLMKLAAFPWVRNIEPRGPINTPDDTEGRSLHRAFLLNSGAAGAINFDGTGEAVLVRDDGFVGPHIDFQGRLMRNTANNPGNTHGDGVGGIMAGAGNLNPIGQGMASGANVFVSNYSNQFAETVNSHLNDGVTVTNSSYSDGCNAGYTQSSRNVDDQLSRFPNLMHVFSAGNSGTSNCNYGAGTAWGNITGGQKMSKNSLATANLQEDATLENTSSRGPAHDGRLKPDISAHGAGQLSTGENNTYQTFGGTSAAAPGIAGVFAQLRSAWKLGIQPGTNAPAALIKLSLLNTANDLGNVGPDFKFGWGLVNGFRAYNMLQKRQFKIDTLDQGITKNTAVQVPDGLREARFMVYWVDPIASTGTTRALVNDLDMVVEDPNGNIIRPLILDHRPNATTLDLPAFPGRDSVNNMEQARVTNPQGGTYTVRVIGNRVPIGPEEFYIGWEFLENEVKVVFPNTGASLPSRVPALIHWDGPLNQSASISFSPDSGATWRSIGTSSRGLFTWTPDGFETGKALMKVNVGNLESISTPFSVGSMPVISTIAKCVDTIFMSFSGRPDWKYEAFLLGGKYMEPVGISDEPKIKFTIPTGKTNNWVAVRAIGKDGYVSMRTQALNADNLSLSCPRTFDLSLRNQSPVSYYFCKGKNKSANIQLGVKNLSIDNVTGARIKWVQEGRTDTAEILLNNFAFQDSIPVLIPNVSLDYIGKKKLFITLIAPGDRVLTNNSLALDLESLEITLRNSLQEPFTSTIFPPSGWAITNPDAQRTWGRQTVTVQGGGGGGQTARLPHFGYSNVPTRDELQVYLDADSIRNPFIVFDISKVNFSTDRQDGLIVEALPQCENSMTPISLYSKFGDALATRANMISSFLPNNVSNWRSDTLDIDALDDTDFLLKFIAVNGQGNQTYLDNVRMISKDAPNFISQDRTDTVCSGFRIPLNHSFTGFRTSNEFILDGAELFRFANPRIFEISFDTPGNKQVSWIIKNFLGADTLRRNFLVLSKPNPKIEFVQNGLDSKFSFTSNPVDSVIWDFGDGDSSRQLSPDKTYADFGNYKVILTVFSKCGIERDSIDFSFINNVVDFGNKSSMKFYPNPMEEMLQVESELNMQGNFTFEWYDISGKKIKSSRQFIPQGKWSGILQTPDISGMYILRIISEKETRSIKLMRK